MQECVPKCLKTEYDAATHVVINIAEQRIQMFRISKNDDGTFSLIDVDNENQPPLTKTLEQLRNEGFNPIEYQEAKKSAPFASTGSIQVVSAETGTGVRNIERGSN